ncbi:hypothetical protein SK3146_06572 [Paenibacillus konkukensis]|uniref:Lipoprotein n=1 Tax=Paenibacillus konkukensis TaxID=2020716 RepID=A0ABY4S003_9BACL|nr:hypothetical protein [Paenibacillus konkukensis]UQZ87275.1 hypothetical protein SK3146_06572 [Paenibacillus konkukensis]
MEHQKQGNTRKMLALFLSAALAAATGCSNTANSNCVDRNGDGYCDNGSGGSSSRAFFGGGGSGKSGTSEGSSSISDGSSTHGGIGSSGSGSG